MKPRILPVFHEPVEPEKPVPWFITFGGQHAGLRDSYVVVYAYNEADLKKIIKANSYINKTYAMVYPSAEKAGVEEFNLNPLTLAEAIDVAVRNELNEAGRVLREEYPILTMPTIYTDEDIS